MPPRKQPTQKKKKIKYPDSCYDLIPYEDTRGAIKYYRFPNEQKMREYQMKYDIETLDKIKKKQDEIEKEKQRKKEIAAEKRREQYAAKPKAQKKAAAKKRKRAVAEGKRKQKRKLLKADEEDAEEDVIEVFQRLEEEKSEKLKGAWERENEKLKAEEKRLQKLQNQYDELVEELLDVEIDKGIEGLVEGDSEVQDYVRRLEQEYHQILKGNNTNTQSFNNALSNAAMGHDVVDVDDDDDDFDDAVPFGESIYAPRKERTQQEITEEKKRLRRSNYFLTIVTNASLQKYTVEEIEVITRVLTEEVNAMLWYYAPDYIKILEANGDMDLIERIEFITKPEMQNVRAVGGQLHTHSIIAITHYTKVQLDYNLINELIKEIAAGLGFKKKDGGVAKFQVQIQRASDSAQNEYEYLDEEGVSYEAGDIGQYYEQAEEAIRGGSMERSDLRAFRRRKKEVASAQKTVRELRGQKFGF